MFSVDTLHHLQELRRRTLRIAAVFMGLFVILVYFSKDLLGWVISPLTTITHQPLIATQITAPWLVPIELAAYCALLMSVPYALGECWAFVRPALYPNERNKLYTLCLISFLLLVIGLLFGFYFALPLLLTLFAQINLSNIQLMPDIRSYIAFCGHFMLVFALLFQLPLVLWTLLRLGWIKQAQCTAARPYIIVSAFIVGMLLTPPDVFAQILVAIPLCLLYELGLVMGRWVDSPR